MMDNHSPISYIRIETKIIILVWEKKKIWNVEHQRLFFSHVAPLIFVNKYKSHLTKKLDLTCARPKAKSPINCLYDYKLMFYSPSCHANGSLFKLNGLHRLHFTDRTLQPIFSSPQNELIMFLLFTTPVGFILHTSYFMVNTLSLWVGLTTNSFNWYKELW